MTKRNQIYKCEICGNVVEVINEGVGQLVCCGQPMKLVVAKSGEEGQEKHKPVIEREGELIKVRVGSIKHPMEENHFIERIELIKDGRVIMSKTLYPGEEPVAYFNSNEKKIEAQAYCNLHGLWKS